MMAVMINFGSGMWVPGVVVVQLGYCVAHHVVVSIVGSGSTMSSAVLGMLRGFDVAVELVVRRTWVRCGTSCGELNASCACVDRDRVGGGMSLGAVKQPEAAVGR